MRSVFGLASFKEEGMMLKQEVNSSMRLAVIVKQTNSVLKVPGDGIGDAIAASIARETNSLLGVESTALQHTPDNVWQHELENHQGKGHRTFFKNQGYDLYVEVVTNPGHSTNLPSINLSGILRERYSSDIQNELYAHARPNKSTTFRIYKKFKPIYRIWKVHPTGEIQRLLAGGESHIECTLDLAECENKFGQDFRRLIEGRFKAADD